MRRRLLAIVALIAGLMVLNATPSAPQVRDQLAGLTRAALQARYEANGTAAAQALSAAPDRQLLVFDPRADGRVVEVIGDLAAAERIAILVPGADTDLATFDGRGDKPYATPGGGARALFTEAAAIDPQADLAVVAWLGYDTPPTLSLGAITDGPAVTAAEHLRSLVTALHGLNRAQISLLCHSYGSRVCARASTSEGLPISDLVAYGSHDLGVSTAAELDTAARVWAGRGTADWVRYLPGPDPVSPRFGARQFSAGDAGHSDYLAPGSVSLRNLALIALGHADAVH